MLLGLLLLAVLLIPILRGLVRASELFRLSAVHGVLKLERGRLPPSLFAELADIAKRERLNDVCVSAVLDGGSPRLVLRGAGDKSAEQPLRNVLGRFTVAQLRSGSLRA